MSEEKLENFGTLLKKSLLNRPEFKDNAPENTSENVLEDAARDAILEKVAGQKEDSIKPPSIESAGKDNSLDSFGVLLERTIAIQENLKKDDNSQDDEIREKVIEKSKFSMIEDMLRVFIH